MIGTVAEVIELVLKDLMMRARHWIGSLMEWFGIELEVEMHFAMPKVAGEKLVKCSKQLLEIVALQWR